MTMFEQFGKDFMTFSNNKWRNWAFKSPLILWRMGLGPVMGHIFSLITVKGRRSGLPRHVLTEYLRDGDSLYVFCAYGAKSQWYKNLMADPHATVQTWKSPEPMKVIAPPYSASLLLIMFCTMMGLVPGQQYIPPPYCSARLFTMLLLYICGLLLLLTVIPPP